MLNSFSSIRIRRIPIVGIGAFRNPLTTRLFILCLLTAAPVSAQTSTCECKSNPGLEKRVEDSSTIFVGRVESISVNPLKPLYWQVKLRVSKRIKGFAEIPTDTVTVYTALETQDCGVSFGVGMDYLVFAKGTLAFFETDKCMKTRSIEEARKEIALAAKLVAGEEATR